MQFCLFRPGAFFCSLPTDPCNCEEARDRSRPNALQQVSFVVSTTSCASFLVFSCTSRNRVQDPSQLQAEAERAAAAKAESEAALQVSVAPHCLIMFLVFCDNVRRFGIECCVLLCRNCRLYCTLPATNTRVSFLAQAPMGSAPMACSSTGRATIGARELKTLHPRCIAACRHSSRLTCFSRRSWAGISVCERRKMEL